MSRMRACGGRVVRPRIGLRRPGAWFILAAALAVLAFVVAGGIGGGDLTGRVLVARTGIPAGTLIDEEIAASSLAIASVPDDLSLRGLLSAAGGALGRRVAAPIGPGEPITQAALGGSPGIGPSPLVPGERAVPIPLRAAGGPAVAPGPGSRVDVIASDGEGPAGRTRIVVTDAEVLAITPPAGDGGGDVTGGLVLRLRTDQALEVARALDFAREVRVVTRPAGER